MGIRDLKKRGQMFKKITIIFILFLGVCSFSYSYTLPVELHLKKAVVYQGKALLECKGKAIIDKKGTYTLLMEIFSENIDKDSIQAEVKGEGKVIYVKFREIPIMETEQKKIKELKQKIQELEDKLKMLDNTKDTLKIQKDLLNSLKFFVREQFPKELETKIPSSESLESLFSFVENKSTQINKGIFNIEIEQRKANKELKLLRKKLFSITRHASAKKRYVEISFFAFKPQQIEVDVSFCVWGPKWKPLYKIQLDKGFKNCTLEMFAQVYQKTSWDWKNVFLTVSTAQPIYSLKLPSLESFRITPQGLVPSFSARKRLKFAQIFSGKGRQESAEFEESVISSTPVSREYSLPERVDVNSQEEYSTFLLYSKKLDFKSYYYCIPRISPEVYLVLEVVPLKDFIPGKANIYFGKKFIGNTYLESKISDRPLQFCVGKTRDIKVLRKKVKDKIKQTFFGKIERATIIRELGYKIYVENIKKVPVKIKIVESIPVSTTDKVKIKNVKFTPPPTEKNLWDQEGVNMWNLFCLLLKRKRYL